MSEQSQAEDTSPSTSNEEDGSEYEQNDEGSDIEVVEVTPGSESEEYDAVSHFLYREPSAQSFLAQIAVLMYC